MMIVRPVITHRGMVGAYEVQIGQGDYTMSAYKGLYPLDSTESVNEVFFNKWHHEDETITNDEVYKLAFLTAIGFMDDYDGKPIPPVAVRSLVHERDRGNIHYYDYHGGDEHESGLAAVADKDALDSKVRELASSDEFIRRYVDDVSTSALKRNVLSVIERYAFNKASKGLIRAISESNATNESVIGIAPVNEKHLMPLPIFPDSDVAIARKVFLVKSNGSVSSAWLLRNVPPELTFSSPISEWNDFTARFTVALRDTDTLDFICLL